MKKSELIKELQSDLAKYGDSELLEYKIVCELEGKSGFKYSPTRTIKRSSRRAKMNMKEFRAYCKNQKPKHGPWAPGDVDSEC